MLATYKKIWKHRSHIFFISQHFGNPESPIASTLPTVTNAELIFSFLFPNTVDPKQLGSTMAFKDFYDGGILEMDIWKA